MNRTRGIAAAVLAAGLVLAGCSSGSGSGDYAEPQRGADDAGTVDMDAEAADSESAVTEGQTPAQDGGAVQVREVITTAEVSLVVADPAGGATEVVRLTETAGGRVDQRTVRTEQTSSDADGASDRPARADLTVRIPAADLDDFLVDLEEVGEVGEVSQTSEDVTRLSQDLDARIEALETSTDRLLEIMAEADDTEALIAIEEALSQRQSDLESLQSQRAYLSDQVALSTVHLALTAESDPVIEASGFTGGLQTGWNALLTFVAGLLAFAGILLPWLAVLAIPALVTLWLVRKRRSRRKAAEPQAMAYAGQAYAGQAPAGPAPFAESTPPTGPAPATEHAPPAGQAPAEPALSTEPAPGGDHPPSSVDDGPTEARNTDSSEEGETT